MKDEGEIRRQIERMHEVMSGCQGPLGLDPDDPALGVDRYLREYHRLEGFFHGLHWALKRKDGSGPNVHRLKKAAKAAGRWSEKEFKEYRESFKGRGK